MSSPQALILSLALILATSHQTHASQTADRMPASNNGILTRGDDDNEPTIIRDPSQSLRQEHFYQFEPSIAFARGTWRTHNARLADASDQAAPNSHTYSGVELAAKLLTDSDARHLFLIGFDLRELLAWDPSLITDLRFGLRGEIRPGKRWPDFAASWLFGDLYRPTSRGMQFSGTSWALSVSKEWHIARWGVEYNFGNGSEGGGFIDRGAQGTHRIEFTSIGAFVKFPFLVEY